MGEVLWGGNAAQPLHHPLTHPDCSDLEGEGAPRKRGLQVHEEQSRDRIPEQKLELTGRKPGTSPPPCKRGEDAGFPSVCELGL